MDTDTDTDTDTAPSVSHTCRPSSAVAFGRRWRRYVQTKRRDRVENSTAALENRGPPHSCRFLPRCSRETSGPTVWESELLTYRGRPGRTWRANGRSVDKLANFNTLGVQTSALVSVQCRPGSLGRWPTCRSHIEALFRARNRLVGTCGYRNGRDDSSRPVRLLDWRLPTSLEGFFVRGGHSVGDCLGRDNVHPRRRHIRGPQGGHESTNLRRHCRFSCRARIVVGSSDNLASTLGT